MEDVEVNVAVVDGRLQVPREPRRPSPKGCDDDAYGRGMMLESRRLGADQQAALPELFEAGHVEVVAFPLSHLPTAWAAAKQLRDRHAMGDVFLGCGNTESDTNPDVHR